MKKYSRINFEKYINDFHSTQLENIILSTIYWHKSNILINLWFNNEVDSFVVNQTYVACLLTYLASCK